MPSNVWGRASSGMIYAFNPVSSMPAPEPDKTELPTVNVPGWQEYDYQDYRDIEAAITLGKPIEYAQCQWILHQAESEAVLGVAFPGGKWEVWYTYAASHCPRFAKEQPRWVRDGLEAD